MATAVPLQTRDPFLIEAHRLHLVLDNLEDGLREKAARADFERLESDSPDWLTKRDEYLGLQRACLDNMDAINFIHWVLNRDVAADAPDDIALVGELVNGVYAGPVACFKRRIDTPQFSRSIDFTDFESFSISAAGWLVGKGSYPQPAKSLTYRTQLLPVPFKKVELIASSRTTLTLKILS